MKYGIYKGILTIGMSGGDREDRWDVRDTYKEDEWEKLGEEGQELVLQEWLNDALSCHVEMSYQEVD